MLFGVQRQSQFIQLYGIVGLQNVKVLQSLAFTVIQPLLLHQLISLR